MYNTRIERLFQLSEYVQFTPLNREVSTQLQWRSEMQLNQIGSFQSGARTQIYIDWVSNIKYWILKIKAIIKGIAKRINIKINKVKLWKQSKFHTNGDS